MSSFLQKGGKVLQRLKNGYCFSGGGRARAGICFPLSGAPLSVLPPPPCPILSATQPPRGQIGTPPLTWLPAFQSTVLVGMLSLFPAFPSHSSLRQRAPQACLISCRATPSFQVCGGENFELLLLVSCYCCSSEKFQLCLFSQPCVS